MIRVTVLLLLSLAFNAVWAEQIAIGISKQAPEHQTLSRPKKGMTQQQIIDQFGEPQSRTEARGNPPISTWIYTDFSVYFESDIVIHSVLKHRPKNLQSAE